MTKLILIIEDDAEVRAVMVRNLDAAGFRVTAVGDAASADPVLATGVDLAVIDLRLPDADGLALTRKVRESHDIGVIIVSGLGDPMDRVIGLEVGADDYLAKPFEPRELVARVRSVLRRDRDSKVATQKQPRAIYQFDGWHLDLVGQMLRNPDGAAINLTSGEYKLLEALVTHANRVLSRDQLMDLVSSNDAAAFDRSIDVRVGRLRRKLGADGAGPQYIRTVRNSGYIFAAKVELI